MTFAVDLPHPRQVGSPAAQAVKEAPLREPGL